MKSIRFTSLFILLWVGCGGGSTPVEKVVALTGPSGSTVTVRKPEHLIITEGDGSAEDQSDELVTGSDLSRTAALSPRMRAAILAGLSNADLFDDLLTADVKADGPVPIASLSLKLGEKTCDASFSSNVFATVPSTCLPELFSAAPLLNTAAHTLLLSTTAPRINATVTLAPGGPEGLADMIQLEVDVPAKATLARLEGSMRLSPAASLTQPLQVYVILIVDKNADGIASVDERLVKLVEVRKDLDLTEWVDKDFAEAAIAANAGKKLKWTFIAAVRGTTNVPDTDTLGVSFALNARAIVAVP